MLRSVLAELVRDRGALVSFCTSGALDPFYMQAPAFGQSAAV